MIDAYTIGITLALDSGVASGIAAIRQDLAALDRAVASSSANLLAMRRLSESLNVASPPRQITPLPGLPPVAAQPLEFAPPAAPPAAQIASPEGLPSVHPRREMSKESLSPNIVSTISAPIEPMSAPRPGRPIEIPSPDAPAAPLNGRINPQPTVSAAPRPNQFAAPSPPIYLALPALPTAPARPIAQPSEAPLPSRLPRLPEPPSHAPRRPAATVQHTALAPVQLPSSKTLAYKPTQSAQPQSPARIETSPPAPESVPNATTGSAHGEIILDGARLGRWMSDQLARAASRPNFGTTAFDPRLSAIYPGAPTGY